MEKEKKQFENESFDFLKGFVSRPGSYIFKELEDKKCVIFMHEVRYDEISHKDVYGFYVADTRPEDMAKDGLPGYPKKDDTRSYYGYMVLDGEVFEFRSAGDPSFSQILGNEDVSSKAREINEILDLLCDDNLLLPCKILGD